MPWRQRALGQRRARLRAGCGRRHEDLAALAGTTSATTWDEALALSRQQDKPILIDFFTEW